MRVRTRRVAALVLVGVIFALLVSRCTVLGFGAGALVDQVRATRYDALPPERVIEEAPLHTPVVLVMLDSTQIVGRYEGVGSGKTADSSASPEPASHPGTQRIAILVPGGSVTHVAVDSIASLAVAAPKHGKAVGTLIGLAIDISYSLIYVFLAGSGD